MKRSAKLTRAIGICIFSAAFTVLIIIVLFGFFIYKGINFDAVIALPKTKVINLSTNNLTDISKLTNTTDVGQGDE